LIEWPTNFFREKKNTVPLSRGGILKWGISQIKKAYGAQECHPSI